MMFYLIKSDRKILSLSQGERKFYKYSSMSFVSSVGREPQHPHTNPSPNTVPMQSLHVQPSISLPQSATRKPQHSSPFLSGSAPRKQLQSSPSFGSEPREPLQSSLSFGSEPREPLQSSTSLLSIAVTPATAVFDYSPFTNSCTAIAVLQFTSFNCTNEYTMCAVFYLFTPINYKKASAVLKFTSLIHT